MHFNLHNVVQVVCEAGWHIQLCYLQVTIVSGKNMCNCSDRIAAHRQDSWA